VSRPLILGHRGASARAPENTLAALRRALADGADGSEIDVRLTRDGVPVVLHDADLVRTSNDPRKVGDLSFADLGDVDVGRWFGPEYAGERVPALAEALAALPGSFFLECELKVEEGEDPERLAAAAAATLTAARRPGRFVLTSFDEAAIRIARRLAPDCRTGLILAAPVPVLPDLPVALYAVEAPAVTAALVRQARAAGREVHAWTVDSPAEAARLAALGVAALITNDPAALR
jgi:glycerophosphoryl diester phosphodiesterase